ncbi:MAG: type II toxin-antitoxin system VapC family toxin [Candidatus Dormibacteria bacterium]
MIVVDTSAVLDALSARPPNLNLIDRIGGDGDLHAPHLIDVELLHALRRLVRLSEISDRRATEVRLDYAELAITRYPHHPLADRMWELRHNLTAYDAAFVALSEALGVPLVTTDSALGGASGHRARVEVIHP